MVWTDYDDEYGVESEYTNTNAWEIRINDEHVDFFEEKEDAIRYLIEEMDNLTDNKFLINLALLGYTSEDDFFYTIIEMCAFDFYNEISNICDEFNISEEFKLVNLDNDEPEYGEL